MNEQWKELKETIVELRDSDGTGTQQEVCKFLVNYMDILEKQMQEPCEDEYVKVPKKALKYRTAGMVAYNAEWLKNNFDIERAVICGAQESCGDAISRQAVLDLVDSYSESRSNVEDVTQDIISDIVALPPVNPQAKTGHWIDPDGDNAICSCCNRLNRLYGDFCKHCGAKMIKPQESENKE